MPEPTAAAKRVDKVAAIIDAEIRPVVTEAERLISVIRENLPTQYYAGSIGHQVEALRTAIARAKGEA